MDKHSPTHESIYGPTRDRVDCPAVVGQWRDYRDMFGVDRCNDPADAILGGLHYSTRTASLIAANDGRDFGVYLFRTPGGRFFSVRVNYPYRDQRSDPIDLLTVHAAMNLYGTIASRSWATVDPIAEAFPGQTIEEA